MKPIRRRRRTPAVLYNDIAPIPVPPVAPPLKPDDVSVRLWREVAAERAKPTKDERMLELMERVAASNEQMVELLSSIEARLDELAHGE